MFILDGDFLIEAHLRNTDGFALSGVLNPEEAKRRIEETLRANAERPLFSGTAVCGGHVYRPESSYLTWSRFLS